MSDKKGLEKLAERSKIVQASKPMDQFFRLKDVTQSDDHFPAFVVEMVTIQGRQLLRREDVTKRDLKAMGLTIIQEVMENGGFEPEVPGHRGQAEPTGDHNQ